MHKISQPIRSSRWAHVVLTVLALIYAASMLLYSTIWMVAIRSKPALPPVELGFDYDFISAEAVYFVKSVYSGSPAEKAGLLRNDKIFAINDNGIKDANYLNYIWNQYHPGQTVHLSIKRPGLTTSVHLTGIFRLRQAATSEGSLEYFASEVRNSFPVPFVVVGLAILFLRLKDPTVWLLALLFGSFTAAAGVPDPRVIAPELRPFVMACKTIFLSFLAPLFYFFFAVFPVRSPIDRRLPWLKWVAMILGLSFTLSGLRVGQVWLPPPLHAMVGEAISVKITFDFIFAFLTLGLVSLGLNFARNRDPEVRRKIRVILWGTGLGVAPTLIQAGAEKFLGYQAPNWLSTTLVALLFLFPLSFAYAVVKHRVLEIPVLIKRSARYLLVQRGFTVLLSLVSIGLTLVVAFSLSRYAQSAIDITKPFGIALGAALGTALLWVGKQIHKRVSEKIDRAFFRSAYDARLILENLAEKSATAMDRRELVHLLDHQLKEALQPDSLVVYLRMNDDWLEAVSGAVPDQLQTLSSKLPILTELAGRGQPSEFPLAMQDGNAEISALQPECLVPMVGRGGRLAGLLVLGPRLSEESYSGEDKRLLTFVAIQAATALENMRLAEEIAERKENEMRVVREMEISRRLLEADNARKTKELEEARALQLSMLPRALPVLPQLDIAVYMKTATEVGGDYYDFAVAPDGTLTVALGDATGHGTKAGMMVVIAKSLFYGFVHIPEVREIFEKYTGSIKKMGLGSLYMAMLLLRIKEKTLVASSAGMPPPLIYRAATGEVEELVLKGMPLGCFQHFPYEQRELHLSAGDTVVLMSDGFPEMFNDKQEILDYARLREIIGAVGQRSPQDIIDHLAQTGQAWANGRPQNDDVTFVVLQVKRNADCQSANKFNHNGMQS